MASFKSNILYVSVALAVIVVNCQADQDDSTPHNEGMHLFHGDIKPDFQKCLDQAGTTKDELIANRGNPPTPKELCLEKCIAESTGILKDGLMLTDVIKVIITAIDEINPPSSCANIPKTNQAKEQWLTSNLRENLCQLWECSLDLLEKRQALVFSNNAHSVKWIKDVPFDPDDPLNTVTEVIVLKACVLAELGNKKFNCAIDHKSYVKITACAFGVDRNKDEYTEQVEEMFNKTVRL